MQIINHRKERGASALEFGFITLTLVPLLLGIGVTGVDMIRTLETNQLARDAGHMFSRGVDMSQPGNQTVLAALGAQLGLATSNSGSAVVILSALTYVDNAACAAAGAVDSQGNPSGCTNFGKWVFAIRLVIGNSTLRASNLGGPLAGGPTGVTINANGTISVVDYVTKAGAVAQFNSINPYSSVGSISGLPSGQYLYIGEASATMFTLPPFETGTTTYSYGLF